MSVQIMALDVIHKWTITFPRDVNTRGLWDRSSWHPSYHGHSTETAVALYCAHIPALEQARLDAA